MHWNLSYCKISQLPELFSTLVGSCITSTCTSLYFQLLPESLGNITVGRDLHLNNSNPQSLPESFGNITVAGV